jgi:hypothetical protein
MNAALQKAVRDRALQTPTGRATIQALRLNRADAVAVRDLLMREGVYDVK